MAIRITGVETIVVSYPYGLPEQGLMRDWPVILIHSDEGLTGIGRGPAGRILPKGAESKVGGDDLISQELAPLLLGQDPLRISLLWERMYERAWRYGGPRGAAMSHIGALDVALWDLYGKVCGQPVWRLLGGYRDRVPAYADGIGYPEQIDQSPEAVAALVKKHIDLGYTAVKFHAYNAEPHDVLEKVRLSREVLGPEKKLMIDLHRAWDGKLAAEMARQLEPYHLYWIEEPVRGDDETAYMRMVREASSALLAGGESEGTLYGIRRLITEGGLQVVQTDILGGGGLTGGLRIAALAEAYHLPVAPHGARFPDINCHLAAAVPNGLIVSTCPDSEPWEIWSKLYDPPFRVVDSHIQMTDKPGLGLELNWDFVNEYRAS